MAWGEKTIRKTGSPQTIDSRNKKKISNSYTQKTKIHIWKPRSEPLACTIRIGGNPYIVPEVGDTQRHACTTYTRKKKRRKALFPFTRLSFPLARSLIRSFSLVSPVSGGGSSALSTLPKTSAAASVSPSLNRVLPMALRASAMAETSSADSPRGTGLSTLPSISKGCIGDREDGGRPASSRSPPAPPRYASGSTSLAAAAVAFFAVSLDRRRTSYVGSPCCFGRARGGGAHGDTLDFCVPYVCHKILYKLVHM